MHAVEPYPCRRSQAASSDDLLRANVNTVSRAPPRSPSPLFRPFTRAGWQHHPHNDARGDRTDGRARTSGGGGGHKGSLSVGTDTGPSRAGGPPPPLTLEEFEALPVAIQRKYFSTPERLRFVQGSRHVDGIVQHYSAITAQNAARRRRNTVTAAASIAPTSQPSAATAAANAAAAAAAIATSNKTRRSASRSVSETFASRLRKRSMRDLSSTSVPTPDSAFYASLPDKIKKRAFTPEEQVLLSGHQGRYQSRPRPHPLLLATTGPDITVDTPISATFSIFSDTDVDRNDSLDGNNSTPATPTTTMPSPQPRKAMPGAESAASVATIARKRTSGVPDSFYDSFQCLEDGEGLDLRLSFDDYHANLRVAARPVTTATKSMSSPPLSPTSASSVKERRPSTAFRRHLSISKMAFHTSGNCNGNGNNNSSSSARPATTTLTSSGRSSPLAFSSSTLPPLPLPHDTSHTGPYSSSLVASPSLSSLPPASSTPPIPTTTLVTVPAPVTATTSASTQPPPTAQPSSSLLSHTRRKSRAMSLITPSSNSGGGFGNASSTKHAAHGSLSAAALIDPAAAHYQDPEARLKLRLYLASPQKFDEAIQYGFPAMPLAPEEATATASDPLREKMTATSRRKRTASQSASSSSPTRVTRPGSPTLLPSSPLACTTTASVHDRPSWEGAMDKSKRGDDDDRVSTPADPDSPKTPNEDEAAESAAAVAAAVTKHSAVRPYRIPAPASTTVDDSGRGALPASREMTLRMTLTRLDLRAAEDQMYGWQQGNHSHQHHLGHSHQHSRKLSLGGGSGNRKMAGTASASSGSSSSVGLSSALPVFSSAATAQPDVAHGPASMTTTPRITYIGGGLGVPPGHERNAKESIEQVFAGIDQWGDLDTQEKGMMKRFWNRVRRV